MVDPTDSGRWMSGTDELEILFPLIIGTLIVGLLSGRRDLRGRPRRSGGPPSRLG